MDLLGFDTQAVAAPAMGLRILPESLRALEGMTAEGDLVWAVWNAVRVAYRSGPRHFAPHGTP